MSERWEGGTRNSRRYQGTRAIERDGAEEYKKKQQLGTSKPKKVLPY